MEGQLLLVKRPAVGPELLGHAVLAELYVDLLAVKFPKRSRYAPLRVRELMEGGRH